MFLYFSTYTILYALLVLLEAVLVTTITSLYDLTIYSYSINNKQKTRGQFSVPQIPTRGQFKKVVMFTSCWLLPWYYYCDIRCTIVTSEQHLYQTMVHFDKTIVLPWKLATGNIHDYLFCYCPLVGILFEVLRIIDQCYMIMPLVSRLGDSVYNSIK